MAISGRIASDPGPRIRGSAGGRMAHGRSGGEALGPQSSAAAHLLDRRAFLRLAVLAGATPLASSGCRSASEIEEAERELLEKRRIAERSRSGRGPLGPLRFRGYAGLARLPWFELDAAGRLVLADRSLPRGIDLHTHLGMAALFAPFPDLWARSEEVHYLLDCDGRSSGGAPCDLDLDVYINENFTPEGLRRLRIEALRQLTIGSAAARTHTIPNLVAELDRMRFERACVLPIDFGLPFRGDMATRFIDAVAGSDAEPRLILGGSVHPRAGDAVARLRDQVHRGARILKLHPEMQRFYPSEPAAMELYAECERIGVPVLFHCGRSGIEPERIRGFALPRHFEEAIAAHPRLPFILGHGGARDHPEAVELARRHPHVTLGIASLGATAVLGALQRLGPERILFGSDWPFYPIATALAKVLLATREQPAWREPVLRGNALRILASVEERRAAFLRSGMASRGGRAAGRPAGRAPGRGRATRGAGGSAGGASTAPPGGTAA